ncbi:DUF6915 family protein [Arcticibacterium luteifluviistationis]|uniref:DUF6915 domain-containing protein n=1 Tax=Arcticibacterium luteifluviistationis TaxID=1784714 RepID=A0A2Z4GHP7_9BACT|nr:hypothetical protein [Arcticibacterium luteifluviistationis]AWW00797.1 hypothetical protein DJ013_04385 [Arcticibacterium luteifluviistationis]
MNAYKHAELSAKRRGGLIEDYLPIHKFIDSTKELCSDNRHRILHNLWGIRRVINPIFGETIVNSSGRTINIKDLCEQDHILPDYGNKFIPTLHDFSQELASNLNTDLLDDFILTYENDDEVKELLLSPLAITGNKKSLFFTHNSWFINEIIPKIFPRKARITDFEISPSYFFESMNFTLWMDNGNSIPQSARKIQNMIVG